MKKIKAVKGITLVALIITIVVLLILASVAISTIKNDGIIGKAEIATTNFKTEQINENSTLDGYLNYLGKYSGLSEGTANGNNTAGGNSSTGNNTTTGDDTTGGNSSNGDNTTEECTHNWSEWTITKEATCVSVGTQQRMCSICGYTETEGIDIDSTNHNYVEGTYYIQDIEIQHIVYRYKCSWCSKYRNNKAEEHTWKYTCYPLTSSEHYWFKKCTLCYYETFDSQALHYFENGKCTDCGQSEQTCSHTWSNGVCTKCNLKCTHSWSNGKCALCGLICSHDWDGEICSICSMTCTHPSNSYDTSYEMKNYEQHYASSYCGVCGIYVGNVTEDHTISRRKLYKV